MNLNLKTALDSVNLLSTLEKLQLMQKITAQIESELKIKQPKSDKSTYSLRKRFRIQSASKNIEKIKNDTESLLIYVKKLVENGNVAEARKMLSLLSPGSSGRADYWHKVLAVPNVMPGKTATGENVKEDILWIQNNADSYKGKWVALKNGVLLGSHESRADLHKILKQSGQLADAMFFQIEN